MAQQQKVLLYVLPLIFAFSGVNFPIGVLLYWTTTNLWSMGQQFYTIRRQPTAGSEAERLRNERLRRKGKLVETDTTSGAAGTTVVETPTPKGQRQQPVGKARAKTRSTTPVRPVGNPKAGGSAKPPAGSKPPAGTKPPAATKPAGGSPTGGSKRSAGTPRATGSSAMGTSGVAGPGVDGRRPTTGDGREKRSGDTGGDATSPARKPKN